MTKRYGSYQVTNGKKPKLDDDESWSDDLDAEALDKCFELATQVCTDEAALSQPKDLSILPPYNIVFKNPSIFTSSTQTNNATAASGSKRLSLHELEAEVRRLKEQNEEKEGEISILRCKIKESTMSVQVEQQKTVNEWRDKLHSAQREARTFKSDLEFKNLEIANLKQQLSDLRRVNLDATINNTQLPPVICPAVKVNPERSAPCRKDSQNSLLQKEPILDPIYPLKSLSPTIFSDPSGESHVIKNTYKLTRNTIPYLQNQQSYREKNFLHKCPRLGNKKITLENIYPEIFQLINSSCEELISVSSVEAINKIICVTLILLKDLSDYLVEYGSHLRTEDVQQFDVNYLLEVQSQSTTRSENMQLGIQASKILDVISQLVKCNIYTADIICSDSYLKLSPSLKEYAKLVPHRNGNVQNDFYLLRLLVTITSNIGKYRLAIETKAFLISIMNLLECIVILDNPKYMLELTVTNNLFCQLFKEIIFARPGHEAIHKMTSLLKVSSRHKNVLQYLFRKNENNELLKAGPKGVLYYNDNVCCFCVLAILLQNYSLRTENLPLEVCYNMLSFIYNSFKTSHWMHHENGDNVCACLSQLYKLEIEFVFRGLSDFLKYYGNVKSNCSISVEWSRFLNHAFIQKVINQMAFNNFELTEKYVMVFSQFKEIEGALKNEGLFNVAQLNTSEELLRISHNSFNKDF